MGALIEERRFAKRQKRNLLPILLIAAGFLLLVGGILFTLYSQLPSRAAAAPLPERIGSLALVQKSTGKQALEEITRLHGKQFPLVSAAVGTYGNQQAILWVSGASSASIAAGITGAMRDKIAEGNSPFVPVAERQQGERVVYEFEGMGQHHFYFQSGELVVWLSAIPTFAETALSEILDFYP